MKVSGKDVAMAKTVLTQYGGPDGESGASLRYLTQRFTMPLKEGKAILTDIGTEELAHMEMIACLFEQLIKGATKDEMLKSGFDGYYVEHGCNPFYLNTAGQTFDTYSIGSKGDATVDMYEDMAAEQKARITYENLIKMSDDPLLKDSLRYLREREVVHFQRFGETLRLVEEYYGSKKIF
jgi:spore coat protein JC